MKILDYVACPLCGTTRPVESKKRDAKGLPLWKDFGFSTDSFIQVREGGGKVPGGSKGRGRGAGYGFRTIDSLTLSEALQRPEHATTIDELKDAIINFVKEAKAVGLITGSDLK